MSSSHKIECIIVKWIRPPMGWIKLNTDGSHNSVDSIGAGGIIRDSNGKIMMAFAKYLGIGSSNLAEAKAIIYGLQWCISHRFQSIILESDSLIIVNMIKGKSNTAWQLQNSIDAITQMLSQTTNIVQHCYREANQVADALAKWSIEEHERRFYDVKDLPKQAAGAYFLDIQDTASIRHKQRRNMLV